MNEITAAILNKNNHLVLSTICDDGVPWAVPVHFAYDNEHVYWVSNSETIHSKNIEHNGRVAITIFDSHQTGTEPGEKGALYISTNAQELKNDEAAFARTVYFKRYPDRNIERFQEWSIYGAPIGVINELKSVAQMIYYVNESENV